MTNIELTPEAVWPDWIRLGDFHVLRRRLCALRRLRRPRRPTGEAMSDIQTRSRRHGKTMINICASKAAQARGKKVLWATHDQAATAEMLAEHGALSEVIGQHYLAPRFRGSALQEEP